MAPIIEGTQGTGARAKVGCEADTGTAPAPSTQMTYVFLLPLKIYEGKKRIPGTGFESSGN